MIFTAPEKDVERHGFAAGCEAVAVPRRLARRTNLGSAPGAGSAR